MTIFRSITDMTPADARTALELGAAALLAVGTSAGTVAAGDDARLSDSRAPAGAAGGDLAGTYPDPTVGQARGLRETGGPTTLSMAAVVDGEYLRRSGSMIIGGTPLSALPALVPVALASGGADQTVAAGYGAYIPDSYEIENGDTLECASGAIMEIG